MFLEDDRSYEMWFILKGYELSGMSWQGKLQDAPDLNVNQC